VYEEHSLSGEREAGDKSGHGTRERGGALTNWRAESEGQVRSREAGRSERAKGTHFLESAGAEIGHDREKNSASEGVLTSWRAWREERVRTRKDGERARGTHELESAEGKVRTRKESQPARDTHFLESEGGGTSYDTKRK